MRNPPASTLWSDGLPDAPTRSALGAGEEVDVAIVGAGFTGLWTAYYLQALDPALRIAVVEANRVGFGASGRNGGWCTGALAGLDGLLARPATRPGALALQRAVFDAVDEVGRVCEKEGIDCHYHKGGSLRIATAPAQEEALQQHRAELLSWGLGEQDHRWLDADASRARLRLTGNRGGLFTPHCAALDPARLVRGLARVVEARGTRIFESTPAIRIEPGRVETARAPLSARFVVRATEAYTTRLTGLRRRLVPLHSLMIATAPLPAGTWQEIGLRDRETFGDGRRITIYGQRTRDERLAFGARGDYRFGSEIEAAFEATDPRFEAIRRILVSLLPVLEGVEITHRWGGALGVPRSWRPSVGLDRQTGLGWAGGYVGQGVAAANLAGRTLAELIVDAGTERCRLPWVGAQSRSWEPEPLRWLAVSALSRLGHIADRRELETGRSAGLPAKVFDLFVAK